MMPSNDPTIVTSPLKSISKPTPDVSIMDFLFESLDMNYELLKDQIWAADTSIGSSYKFGDIKPLTRKIASGLVRLGFKKGDVLYFSTSDVTLIYFVQLSVWICGGVLRGCQTHYDKDIYAREMREVSCRFVLCDTNTMARMKWASEQLEWDVNILSIGGNVDNATAIEDIIANDDCSHYPHDVKINPKEDVYIIVTTSGSTGPPKSVLHTHHNMVASFASYGAPIKIEEPRKLGRSLLTVTGNHFISTYGILAGSILYGFSFFSSSKFDQKKLLQDIATYKPDSIMMYPVIANIFLQSDELSEHDLSSIKQVLLGGSVLTMATVKLFAAKLPKVQLTVLYGMSEILFTAFSSAYTQSKPTTGKSISGLTTGTYDGCERVSCGPVLPLYEAKIVDPIHKCGLGRNLQGHLWIRGSCLMKGYLDPKAEKGFVSKLEEDGWFDTGDIAYIDENGYLYIMDRRSFTFMYNNNLVSSADIETIVLMHPAVSLACVIGVPHPINNACARAYVVRKPNYDVTAEDIKKYVAERADDHMHLHGGVAFIDEMPKSDGAKINRPELQRMAKREMKIP